MIFGKVAALASMMWLVVPAAASAQVALHELDVKGKLLYQDYNKSDQPRVGRESFKSRDVIGVCLGEEQPDKNLKLFLRIDCQDLGSGGAVEIWNTGSPAQIVEEIGEVSLDELVLVSGASFEEPSSATALAEVEIECGEGAFAAEFGGKFDIKFSEDDQSNFCPRTAKASKLIGGAVVFGEPAILENGSVNAKKPTVNVQP
jgi:hypothetical protein